MLLFFNALMSLKMILSQSVPIFPFLQTDAMLFSEVGAAVSVLLGFAPSSMLSAAGSSKVSNIVC